MISQFYELSTVCGINIHLSAGSIALDACVLKQEKKQLDIDTELDNLQVIGQLKDTINKGLPCALNLTGKGIIHKCVSLLHELDATAWAKLFPGASQADFYVQHFASGQQSFVSVIRKADADRLIAEINKLGGIVVALSLGSFGMHTVSDQLNLYGEKWVFNGHIIELSVNGEWLASSYEHEQLAQYPLKIENRVVKESLILPYAAAFQLLLADHVSSVSADVPALQNAYQEILAKRKLRTGIACITIFMFVILLVNFFYLQQLREGNAMLEERVSATALDRSDYESLQGKSRSQEALLGKMGWDGHGNKAVILDKIAGQMPAGLKLTSIEVNPVDADSTKIRQAVVYKSSTIVLKGNSKTIMPINEWIARLNAVKGISKANLNSYEFDRDHDTGLFIINILF